MQAASFEPDRKHKAIGLNGATRCRFNLLGYPQVSALQPDEIIMCPDQHVIDQTKGYAVAYSGGIRQIRHIHRFLGVEGVVSAFEAIRRQLPVSCVVVWGRKQNSRPALRYAQRRGLPVYFVEDGWIRSCSANAHSRISYSLLVDDLGVYYDSTVPSSLEAFLNLPDDQFIRLCGAEEQAYAAHCRELMIDNNITKYNYCPSPNTADLYADERPLVLVLDQTRDDASVRLGGMNTQLFNDLLDRAVRENPDSRVVVRTHPDVVIGRREGYLQDRAQHLGVEVSAAADNPIAWLKASSVVYVGTSQLGYEALLCGCTVKVGGQPFYAGWGLTTDYQPVARRIRRRTLDQLFHATHVYHARYCCPVTGVQWTLRNCLEHVMLQQAYFQRNAAKHVCVGVTPWKRKYISQFLRSPHGRVRFSARNDLSNDETSVCWSFTVPADQSTSGSNSITRVEDGFIRSKGLGSDFVAPASLVFDSAGLYFDATQSSTLEHLLNTHQCTDSEISRGRRVREMIISANLTKYNVGLLSKKADNLRPVKSQKKSVLVVGQVEGDQSILRGSPVIQTNAELLVTVRESNPDAFIVFKPHPDVVSGNRKGKVDAAILEDCVNAVDIKNSFLVCLEECDELHTMTSLSGFEALMRGKKVVTHGIPFYSGWGLTEDVCKSARRTAVRTVDELVFLSLVLYPHYMDSSTGEFVSVEQLVQTMINEKSKKSGIVDIRWLNKMSNVYKALTYRA